jgi:hypothetical protein
MAGEMIAMLNGLGAYGENPIGDLDPRIAAARSAALATTAPAYAYRPVPYTLGSTGSDTASEAAWYKSKWVWGGVAALAAVWWYDRSQKSQGGAGILPSINGYAEPEMVESLGGEDYEEAPRRKRRKSRKGRK